MWHQLRAIFKPTPAFVTVVSGVPRSGTSMMMRMLEAGGMAVLADQLRQADPDNPQGYYEFERVKQLEKGDQAWVKGAQGQAVKVISALLEHLPATYHYRVIFMDRDLAEVLASQRKMLIRRGEDPDRIDEAAIGQLLTTHIAHVKGWLARQPNFQLLAVDYNSMLGAPQKFVPQINQFLDDRLDPVAMAAVIDPALYRNRGNTP
jgi:Sulfotransferase domain